MGRRHASHSEPSVQCRGRRDGRDGVAGVGAVGVSDERASVDGREGGSFRSRRWASFLLLFLLPRLALFRPLIYVVVCLLCLFRFAFSSSALSYYSFKFSFVVRSRFWLVLAM